MDNPWATAWENPDHLSEKQSEPSPSTWSSGAEQEADIGIPSWSAASTSKWTATSAPAGTIWPAIHGDANAWDPSPADDHSPRHHEESFEQDITAHGERDVSQQTTSSSAENSTAPVSDHQLNHSSPPTHNSPDLVAATFDGVTGSPESVSPVPEQENPDAWRNPTVLAPAENDWGVAWATTPSAEGNQQETQSPDEWESARQEKEKLNRAVPPQLLESMIRHCQQASEEIWPPFGAPSGDNWRTGLDDLPDIARLLAQLLPDDALPPPVQFSATATAKAMNEALKLTRHMPLSASSPLSRLLASRGSLDWERSIKSKQDIVPDTVPVGWRVLEKEDRVISTEDSKPKTAASSLLSFWNRRVSAVANAPAETAKERSMSPTRSSLDSVKPDSPPGASRAASPSQPPPSLAMAPSSTDAKVAVAATTSAPSAVSRFFTRFSRTKSMQHSSLALSSNDFEFLSDIIPSASDPDDEHGDRNGLEAFSSVTISSPLPPKLPPPLPPPPKSSAPQSRPPSSMGLGISDAGNVPPPLSPNPSSSFARAQSPALLLKGMVASANVPRPATPSIPQNLPPGPQPNSRPHSPFTLPPPPKVPTSLSIPPLLPPPPLSPPQTPRPSVMPSTTMSSTSSTTWTTSAPAFYDSHDSDDEFSAFSSFPPAPFPSMGTYPQRSPSPPSPPPRRTYERTHHPSTSSTYSAQSPSSQNSGDRLRSARSSISASFDSFDDFDSLSTARGSLKRTPPPPPIPVKQAQAQRQQLDRIDTFPSRIYHTHTPSHTFASPTVHTGLMSSAFSPTVSDGEHQRTQQLVDDAAAHGGLLWPNSPESPPPHPGMSAIPPPPPSSSMSPKSLIGADSVDLLGDGDFFGSAAQPALPTALVSGLGSGIQAKSPVASPVMTATRAPIGVGRGVSVKNPFPSSLPPLPPSSPSLFSFSSLGAQAAAPVAKAGSSQLAKPAQTGGLSAQDLSFFEGL